jgi:ArsR family transcriptional regulator
MEDFIKATRALADETRLRILNLLMVRECCVCEVVQALSISQTRASRNLGILHDAGFLKVKREGLWSLYSLNKGASGYIDGLVGDAAGALKDNTAAAKDRERLRKAKRMGPDCTPQ